MKIEVFKRWSCLLLALVLMMGILPLTAVAVEGSGMCGDNMTWEMERGILTISGKGKMKDYSSPTPWSASQIKTVVIEEGVTSVGAKAFNGCSSITSITIPKSVTSIGDFAFGGCSGLTNIAIPSGVKSIGAYAFSDCSKLTSFTIPESVTNIGTSAFQNCSALTSILVDSNNKNYSSDARGVLFNKKKTTLIQAPGKITGQYTIPDSVTGIEVWAFANSSGLTGISIPAGLTSMGLFAFEKCTNLADITIPKSVTSVGNWAFSGCSKLKSIKFEGNAPEIMASAFDGVTATVFYPKGNTTWTDAIKQNYGGNITWKSYTTASAISIKTQPKTTYTKQGATAKVSVSAVGDGLKYQWYIKNAGSTSWAKSSVTTNTYTVKMGSTSKNRQVYCVVTDKYGNTVKSNTVYLRMAATITAQPKTTYTKQGATAKVSVSAVGGGLKYQWYVKNAGSTSWVKSSITSNIYTVKMASTSKNRQIYCVITDKYGNSVKSNVATLKLK